MFSRSSVATIVLLMGTQLTSAAAVTCVPQPTNCIPICPTPTATVFPQCTPVAIACPLFRCAPFEPITTTATHYCRGTSCSGVATTSCETVPTVTVQGKCPTGCPDPCPLAFTTVAIGCPTNPPQV